MATGMGSQGRGGRTPTGEHPCTPMGVGTPPGEAPRSHVLRYGATPRSSHTSRCPRVFIMNSCETRGCRGGHHRARQAPHSGCCRRRGCVNARHTSRCPQVSFVNSWGTRGCGGGHHRTRRAPHGGYRRLRGCDITDPRGIHGRSDIRAADNWTHVDATGVITPSVYRRAPVA